MVTPEVEEQIYAAIAAKCMELKCYVLAIGGVEDHVHLLVRFPTVLSVATAYWHELVHELTESGAELPESLRLVVVGAVFLAADDTDSGLGDGKGVAGCLRGGRGGRRLCRSACAAG